MITALKNNNETINAVDSGPWKGFI